MRRLLLVLPLLLSVFAAACSDGETNLFEPEAPAVVPGQSSQSVELQEVTDDWIVLFRPGVADPPGLARRMVSEVGGSLRFTYQHTIQGFAATLPPQALQGIRNNPNVLRVEPDIMVSLVAGDFPVTSPADSWGLDRIDQHPLPMDGDYIYDTDGAGVDAYILDTGILTTHSEFGGRAFKSSDADFVGGDGSDCHGHGTHVAGTVGGATYGVAKAVDLYSVRVLDCNGSGAISGVIAGIDWVTERHLLTGGPSVANMSLAARDPFGFYQALNDAVAASVNEGVVFAVAAANDNADACDYIPASEPEALTVGATDSNDIRASFSNFGYCLDIFAPGVNIKSAFYTGDQDTRIWSGTSMASPHVAGAAALYLGFDPNATPMTVKYHLVTKSTQGVVGNPGPGSPDDLLYSRVTLNEDPPQEPTEPPAAPSNLVATTVSASQIDLSWTDHSTTESSFEIWWSTDGQTFNSLASVGANVTTYSHTGLSANTTYAYQVRAVNSVGPSAFSNTDQATTDEEPPTSGSGAAAAQIIADPEITPEGKFLFATAGVLVTDAENLLILLDGVTVTGDWWWSTGTTAFRATSAVSAGGLALVESGKVKDVPGATLYFCATSLSHPDYTDGTQYPLCNAGFTPPNPGDPPPEPGEPGAPSNLTATWNPKAGGRVELTWAPGGGAEVDVYVSNGSVQDQYLATTADNGRFNDRAGTQSSSYQLCNAGAERGDESSCTVKVPVT